MTDDKDKFKDNMASLIIASASMFMGWHSKDKKGVLQDIAKDSVKRALGEEPSPRSNKPNKARNRNRNRAKQGTTKA